MINLLPEDYIRQRLENRANVLCAAMFIVVMVAVGAAALVSERNNLRTKKVRDQVNASYVEAAKLLTQMRELKTAKRQAMGKAMATASLLERVPRSYLLANLANALPPDTSFTSVELKPSRHRQRQQSKGSKFQATMNEGQGTSVAPMTSELPMSMEVVGLAVTDVMVGRFISQMNRNPLLTSVDLSYSQDKILNEREPDKPKTRVREFKVTMELRPNVDVLDLVKTQVESPPAETTENLKGQGAES